VVIGVAGVVTVDAAGVASTILVVPSVVPAMVPSSAVAAVVPGDVVVVVSWA
jgi:hypothetical protein